MRFFLFGSLVIRRSPTGDNFADRSFGLLESRRFSLDVLLSFALAPSFFSSVNECKKTANA